MIGKGMRQLNLNTLNEKVALCQFSNLQSARLEWPNEKHESSKRQNIVYLVVTIALYYVANILMHIKNNYVL